MADVDVMHTVEIKKTKKVKKVSKKRTSVDQGSEIQITEIEQTNDDGYVPFMDSMDLFSIFFFLKEKRIERKLVFQSICSLSRFRENL